MSDQSPTPMFDKLWEINSVKMWRDEDKGKKGWWDYEIFAKATKDVKMNVWNGRHPFEENCIEHVCKTGTRVRVWMISRFGDVGITDNMDNSKGYDARGLDPDRDLTDYEFIELKR